MCSSYVHKTAGAVDFPGILTVPASIGHADGSWPVTWREVELSRIWTRMVIVRPFTNPSGLRVSLRMVCLINPPSPIPSADGVGPPRILCTKCNTGYKFMSS